MLPTRSITTTISLETFLTDPRRCCRTELGPGDVCLKPFADDLRGARLTANPLYRGAPSMHTEPSRGSPQW